MKPARTLALAIPGAAAVVVWGGYRHAVREFRSDRPPPPRLPGHVRSVATHWGRVSYRMIEGARHDPTLVLVHGWGRSADSAWWPLMEHTDRTIVAVDLPGHGRSSLEERFSFDLAADAIGLAIDDAGITTPVLVGHSMGGPISLMTVRSSPRRFSGLVAVATSAHWVSPQVQMIVAAAPYLFAPRSPIVRAAMRQEARRSPEARMEVTRSYGLRPSRRVLGEAAMELRRFDARDWEGFEMPPALWLVTERDGVIPPGDQRASARHFDVSPTSLGADHSVIMSHPDAVAEHIENFASSLVAAKPAVIRSASPRSVPAEGA